MDKKDLEEKQKRLIEIIIGIEEERYRGDSSYLDGVLEEFRKTQTRIEEHLAGFVSRYSDDGLIDLVTIYYLLTIPEKRKLKYSLEEIIDRGIDEKAADEIQSALTATDITRIKGLQLQVKAELDSLNHNLKDSLNDHYLRNYVDSFNDTHYAFFETLGISKDPTFLEVTKALIEESIKTAYRGTGQNYEDILNYYTNDVIERINREILAALRGMEKYSDIVERIGKLAGMNYRRAEKLIRTDSAYVGTRAQEELYSDFEIENLLFVATLDERTSDICREMDGTIIPLSEVEPGINAPPLHNWCRSVLAPMIDDIENQKPISRAMRDPDTGKTVFTKEYKTYSEWAEEYEISV